MQLAGLASSDAPFVIGTGHLLCGRVMPSSTCAQTELAAAGRRHS
jgi:hypothetical protein